MRVRILFHSYFRDLAGCAELSETLPDGASLGALLAKVRERIPSLKPMERSTLAAVGLEYQPPDYILSEGDQVSLFPPVQGG